MRTTTDVRTVEVHIDPEESEDVPDSWGRGTLRPHVGIAGVDPEGLRSLVLLGSGGRKLQDGQWAWSRQSGPPWPPPDAPQLARRLVRHALADPAKFDVREVAATHEVLAEDTGLLLTDEAIDELVARLDEFVSVRGASPGNPLVRERLVDGLAKEMAGLDRWPDETWCTRDEVRYHLKHILAEATSRGWLIPEEN